MKGNAEMLITDLIERTETILAEVEGWSTIAPEVLNKRPAPEAWSVLECLEHLNKYGDFYLPEIANRITGTKHMEPSIIFKSSWLGEYFAKAMLPREKLNKMKTFKSMNPTLSGLRTEVLEEFIAQQKNMLKLLVMAKDIDMNKTKTDISISKWIRLRLGDTLRVVIYHNERHMVQARKAMNS